jgi:hypothetical protein
MLSFPGLQGHQASISYHRSIHPRDHVRGVLELEVLVRELGAVDGLATGSVTSSKVATPFI